MADEIPTWFNDAVIEGMQVLQVLSLPGTPSAETIGYASDVWVRTLWSAPTEWDEGLDRARMSAAFLALARQIDRWPAPKHVLDHLPPRRERLKLEAPPLSAEQVRRNRAFLRRLLENMTALKPGKSDGRGE